MSLDLAQCARCRRVFPVVRSPVCPECQGEEDADFEKIRAVLDYDSTLSPEDAARAAGVGVDCVRRIVDAGLVSDANVAEVPKCGRCGDPAISRSQRLCEKCVAKLDAQFTKAVGATRDSIRLRAEEAEMAQSIRAAVQRKRKKPLSLFRRPDPPSADDKS